MITMQPFFFNTLYASDIALSKFSKFLTPNPEIEIINAIQRELEDFASAIKHKTNPKVSLQDGARALSVANKIIEAMEY